MIINQHVPLHRLILSLSQAMDYVHPNVADHQQRVAYAATRVAKQMGFKGGELAAIFNGAALHDIGAIGTENRIRLIHLGDVEKTSWHGRLGASMLRACPIFAGSADMVEHHHIYHATSPAEGIPLGAYIIALADCVERAIDRNLNILEQHKFIFKQIQSLSGRQLHPDCVEAFCEIAQTEAFWLDIVSDRIYSTLLRQIDWPEIQLDEFLIEPIAKMFGHIVDVISRWTMVHTAGVATTAVALSKKLSFSPREQKLMEAAGYLHDLGKLSVPSEILDKPAKLNAHEAAIIRGHTYHTFHILDTIGGMPQICEWAAFHHERLDGTGYPFRHKGKDLTLGSRIMAVADVFTATTEDRPYRTGMTADESLGVLRKMVESGGLDGDVLGVLEKNVEEIQELRRHSQEDYRLQQEEILATLALEPQAVL